MPDHHTKPSTLERLQAFQTLNREWRPHLNAAERDVISYVLDNSMCWGRPEFTATVRDMVQGARHGKRRIPPSGHSRANLVRLLASLRKLGVLTMRLAGGASVYGINLQWEPEVAMAMQRNGSTIAQPKRLQRQAEQRAEIDDDFAEAIAAERAEEAEEECSGRARGMLNLSTGHAQDEHATKEEGNLKGSEKGSAVAAGSGSGLPAGEEEGRAAVAIRSRVRPSLSPASVPAAPPAPSPRPAPPAPPARSLEAETAAAALARIKARGEQRSLLPAVDPWGAWREAWLATYPAGARPLPWTKQQRGQISLIANKLGAAKIDKLDFLAWTVANWRGLMGREFGWMKDRPEFPQAGFLLRWLDRFADRYAEAKVRGEISLMPGEKGEYQRLRMAGKTHDEAMVEIGIRRAASSRRAGAGDAATVNAAFREIDRKREELGRREAAIKAREAAPKPAPQPIDHGSNPWETAGADEIEIPTFAGMTFEG